MIEKVTISRISHFDTDKEKKPLVSPKTGKPYTRCLVDTVDGRKISGFGNPVTRTWHEGDEVEMDVEQKGEYWNFKTVKKEEGGSLNQEQLDRIEKMLTDLCKHFNLDF